MNWNDKQDVLLRISQDVEEALRYASDELKNDRDIVLAGVEQSGMTLKYASKEHQNHKEIVLAAVKQNGMALQFANYDLKSNKDIVAAAYNQNPDSLKYASYDLQIKINRELYRKKNDITKPDHYSQENITPKTSHCWQCKTILSTQIHNVCGTCGGISCPDCGACGCGYIHVDQINTNIKFNSIKKGYSHDDAEILAQERNAHNELVSEIREFTKENYSSEYGYYDYDENE